jgi:GcrA cell cycle regulator
LRTNGVYPQDFEKSPLPLKVLWWEDDDISTSRGNLISEAYMDWTEQRIEMLRRLWGQGQTASQIAVALGGVTRNAVIGKAHRLGLTGRPSPIKRDASGAAVPKRRPVPRRALAPQPKPMMPLQRAMPAQPQESGVIASQPPAPREQPRNYPPARAHGGTKSCSWPMGDPKQPGFHFCGEPSEPGRPYCANHCHQAYQRKSEAA